MTLALKLLTALNPYGPQLIEDPGFDNAARWTLTGGAWSIADSKATFGNSGTDYIVPKTAVALVADTVYEVGFTIVGATEGVNAARLALFNQAATVNYFTAYINYTTNGPKVVRFRASTASTNIRIYATAGAAAFSLENYSIRRRAGL